MDNVKYLVIARLPKNNNIKISSLTFIFSETTFGRLRLKTEPIKNINHGARTKSAVGKNFVTFKVLIFIVQKVKFQPKFCQKVYFYFYKIKLFKMHNIDSNEKSIKSFFCFKIKPQNFIF